MRPLRQIPTLLIARRNLLRTKTRSALAMLGIVIGVVAIASLGVFGATLQQAAVGSLGDIGNQVVVTPATPAGDQPLAGGGGQTLSEREVQEIERVVDDATVVPVKQNQSVVRSGGQQQFVTVYGIDSPASAYNASEGRIPDPLRSGALVGSTVAEQLDVQEGNSITVGNRTYRVRAILEQQGGFVAVNPSTAVIVPSDDLRSDGYAQVIVTGESGEAANESAMAIREALNDREERVSVIELGQITDQIGSFFDALNLFLLGIGSISLIVAGVSILNVMLMSTIERREEIGVLRAVGYQRRDVLKILLSEALLLGLIGGAVGTVFSIGAGLLINHFALGNALRVFTGQNLFFILVAFAFGVATSVLSGLYPAYKAANERPVEALRK